ncbi:hypothetical protein PanWU01x14_276830 [Parasponia andersonii]|uniref:Uncharacterized protein n=1 Tax=Parasponia andersonii TaxID=3476 RepID=A0A2P5B2I9_PARAD|nr:hypothetical protein PanWU01x14_276830 [Parasponia andersonii]
MAKRSQRRTVRYEKDQSGCMWGLISIFDFRHGRSTRKLIADRSHGSKVAIGAGIAKNKFEILSNLEENCQGTNIDGEERTALTADTGKPSVKKLIEEEMVNEHGMKKETRDAAVEPKQSESAEGDINTDHKRTRKTRKKSRDMDTHNLNVAQNMQSDCSCKQNADQQSVKELAIDEIMEQFSRQLHQKSISCTKDGLNGETPELTTDRHSDFEEKLNGVIKEFIIQKFTDGKHLKEDTKIHLQFRELMDELQLISSDEELFLKLLQDPQSLLVKYVQSLQDSQVEKDAESKSDGGSEFSEEQLVNSRKSEDLVNNNKHRNFFRRKVKSQERIQLKANESPDTLSKIVILKPGPTGLRDSKIESTLCPSQESRNLVINKEPSDRVGSHFFLAEIKRKFKHAMGKQQHEISGTGISNRSSKEHQSKVDSEKGVGKGNVGRNSPTKDHFYIERIAKPSGGSKRADKVNKMKDSEISKHESDAFPSERISNIYIEAKKHLSELLSNGDGVDLSNRKNPKTLGRILSLPEYSLSPFGSPGRDWENSFVTAQMRFSAQEKCQKINENRCSPKPENSVSPLSREAQNLESQSPITDSSPDHKVQAPNSNPSISDDVVHEIEVEDTNHSIKEDISRAGDSEVIKESIISDSPCEPCSTSTVRNNQSCDVPVVCDDKSSFPCLKQDSHEENQLQSSPPGSPSSSLTTRKVADLESSIDIPDKPSPVSVLEPLFGEDDISPENSISQPDKLTIQPLRIEFEEPNSPPKDESHSGKRFMEDKESIFSYVKALMQASGLDWDEICIKLLSSDQLLEPSLVDVVEFFSNQLCRDQKLLFDCIDEVLVEVCQYYFGCSPWVSFAKPSIRPIPDMKNAIHVVSKGVYWHLLQPPLPPTLDQIIRKDMSRTGTWLDVRFDAETIGFDMGEAILEDLMEDTILSLVNESSESEHDSFVNESSESDHVLLPELKENGTTVDS